jgi:ABC-type branched-subunit amino acid transport system ATPase component
MVAQPLFRTYRQRFIIFGNRRRAFLGQQKLLDCAMAFMGGPRLVLLDEPAGGVNLTMLSNLRERLKAINKEACRPARS